MNSANISKCKGFYHLVPGCVVASTELSPLPRTAAGPTFLLQQAEKKWTIKSELQQSVIPKIYCTVIKMLPGTVGLQQKGVKKNVRER